MPNWRLTNMDDKVMPGSRNETVPLDELNHAGVKGMKWGVRKKYYKEHMDSDRTLKKDFKIQNISRDKAREIRNDSPVYGAHTKKDKQTYAGRYASSMAMMGEKAYINNIQLKKDVKIPSQKKAVDTFMDMYKKDPKGVSRSIANAQSELLAFNKIDKVRNFRANQIDKKLSKKGEDWIANKGYLLFNQSMMASKESKARDEYFKLLTKKGYDAISDINDVQTGYNTQDPIIFINPKKTLKNVSSRELTMREIELANARYQYDQAYENKGLLDMLTVNEYGQAKRNMTMLEKQYGVKKTYVRK